MGARRDRAILSMMTASNIVKNIRPECMNAASTIADIADALASRDLEIERLRDALERIALLDEADGHELTVDHALRAVGIASNTLGKHPSEIAASRPTQQRTEDR